MKKSIVFGLVCISMLSVFIFTTIVVGGPIPPPVDHEIEPTSYSVYHGYHTSGTLSDVYTNNGITMGFQQQAWFLDIYFYFPNEKCDYILFDFTDTATWPFDYVISWKVYYTTGLPRWLGLYQSDGYYSTSIDNSRYIDKVLVTMDITYGQFLRIDFLIAYKN